MGLAPMPLPRRRQLDGKDSWQRRASQSGMETRPRKPGVEAGEVEVAGAEEARRNP